MIISRVLSHVLRNTTAIGWLLLALTGPVQANEEKILILGDSISAAYGMSLEQGWVAQLAEKITDQNLPYTVVNASISGETTAGGLRRLPTLLEENRPALVLIELGANDGLRGYPLTSLSSNLTRLVELSQESSARVILLPMEIPPNYGSRYTAGFRESYRQVAADTGAILAPFILDGVATDTALMQTDGIHPTVEAQPMLLENISPTILQELNLQ